MTRIQNNFGTTYNAQAKRPSITKTAGKAAAVGAAICASSDFLLQRNMFKNAEAYTTLVENGAELQKQAVPFLGLAQDAAESVMKTIDANTQKAKDFITSGKYDVKNIAKSAGRGALSTAACVTGICLVARAVKSIFSLGKKDNN